MLYFLGVDVGTTGTKTILISENGQIIADAYESYTLQTYDNFIEQDAMDWYNSVIHTIQSCLLSLPANERVYALSLSTQGGAFVPTDQNGNALCAAVSWMDKRIGTDKELMDSLPSDNEIYSITGLHMNNCLPLLQIIWLKKHRPEIFNKTTKYLTTIEYINYKLTGKFCGDQTNLAFSLLFDIHNNDFSPILMEYAGVTREQLPEVVPSGHVIGCLTPNAAKELGLAPDTLVISGGHDQYCGAIGSNSVYSGDVMLATGTAWVVLAIMGNESVRNVSGFSLGKHILKDKWGLLASLETGGVSIEWFKNQLGIQDSLEGYEYIDRKASEKAPGSDGMLFYPYFDGSYYPVFNDKNRATFIGMQLSHDRYHMARAIMEGVAFELKRMLEGLQKEKIPVSCICLTGGASKSKLWSEIICNVVGTDLLVPDCKDAPCMGAAILAMYGAGIFDDLSKGASKIISGEIIKPDPDVMKTYQQIYQIYCSKFDKLNNLYNMKENINGIL